MAGDFQVVLDELSGLVRRLSSAHDTMSRALSTLANADTTQTGSQVLSSACGGFHDSWQYGLEQLSKATGGVTDKLKAAQSVYANTEDRVAQSFDTISGKLGGAR